MNIQTTCVEIRPDYRENGQFQFVTGYTGGGAEMCVHLTREEIVRRATEKWGPGWLDDDGVSLWWRKAGERPTVSVTEDDGSPD